MPKFLFALLGLVAFAAPVHAAPVSDGPDLLPQFANAIPGICFPAARGNPPTEQTAAALQLEPVAEAPPRVAAHYFRVTSWFRLKAAPDQIFVGTGDRDNCHLVLANTRQIKDIQLKLIALFDAIGFKVLSASKPGDAYTDMLFALKADDGYMVLSLQAPRDTIRDGIDDQGAVHVARLSKAELAAMGVKL